jgi:hypothetical protein
VPTYQTQSGELVEAALQSGALTEQRGSYHAKLPHNHEVDVQDRGKSYRIRWYPATKGAQRVLLPEVWSEAWVDKKDATPQLKAWIGKVKARSDVAGASEAAQRAFNRAKERHPYQSPAYSKAERAYNKASDANHAQEKKPLEFPPPVPRELTQIEEILKMLKGKKVNPPSKATRESLDYMLGKIYHQEQMKIAKEWEHSRDPRKALIVKTIRNYWVKSRARDRRMTRKHAAQRRGESAPLQLRAQSGELVEAVLQSERGCPDLMVVLDEETFKLHTVGKATDAGTVAHAIFRSIPGGVRKAIAQTYGAHAMQLNTMGTGVRIGPYHLLLKPSGGSDHFHVYLTRKGKMVGYAKDQQGSELLKHTQSYMNQAIRGLSGKH